MRYLGVDYGAKRIGLAVSSEGIAFPLNVIQNDSALFQAFREIIAKERIGAIVVGDARAFGGRENVITKEVVAFAQRLKSETGLAVESVWEAGSSIEASRYAEDRAPKDDSSAAAIILQRYLDMQAGAR